MYRRGIKIVAVLLAVIVLSGSLSNAMARTVYFRKTSTWELFSFDSSSTSNWVGYGYTNKYRQVSIVQAAHNSILAPDYYIAIDGLYGPYTYAGIGGLQLWFQNQGFTYIATDYIVGTQTWSLIELYRGWYYSSQALPFL